MSTVAVSLGVAVVVVFVLLLSCWKSKPRMKKQVNKRQMSRKVSSNTAGSEEDPTAFFSDTGTGPLNRQLSAQYGDLQNMTGYEDYNEVAQYTSLEPEVFSSQEEYSREINRSTSGASAMSVRDDPNDVNPWIGLRKIDYHSVYPNIDARVDSSESPDQMPSQTRYLL